MKRRAYYILWRKQLGQATDSDGVEVSTYGWKPEADATIVE